MFWSIINFIKEVFSPKRCIWCKKYGFFICPECLKKTKEYTEICYVCKKNSTDFTIHENCKKSSNIHFLDKIIILTHYSSDNISTLIKNAKYYGQKDILEDFGSYLVKKLYAYEKIDNPCDYILLTPPMFYFKLWKRKYNQWEELLKVISKLTNIPLSFNVLKKIKYTKQQSKIFWKERFNNLEWSFEMVKYNKFLIEGKKIILVDDVISTGTTLNELAKILKNNGVKSVIWLVIASD